MPYKRIGKNIYSKKSGEWKLKQKSTTLENAKKALRYLQSLYNKEKKDK